MVQFFLYLFLIISINLILFLLWDVADPLEMSELANVVRTNFMEFDEWGVRRAFRGNARLVDASSWFWFGAISLP
jgi:hypothetical protein